MPYLECLGLPYNPQDFHRLMEVCIYTSQSLTSIIGGSMKEHITFCFFVKENNYSVFARFQPNPHLFMGLTTQTHRTTLEQPHGQLRSVIIQSARAHRSITFCFFVKVGS